MAKRYQDPPARTQQEARQRVQCSESWLDFYRERFAEAQACKDYKAMAHWKQQGLKTKALLEQRRKAQT